MEEKQPATPNIKRYHRHATRDIDDGDELNDFEEHTLIVMCDKGDR